MKKINTLVLAVLFSTAMMAQSLTGVSPNSGRQGANAVRLQITGSGSNFQQTHTYSAVFTDTIGGTASFTATQVQVVNTSLVVATVSIPAHTTPGRYNVTVSDGSTTLTGATLFTVTAYNGVADISSTGFEAYPVPAIGQLHITAEPQQQLSDISLTSLSGQVVVHQSAGGDSHEVVDIHGVAAGMYILAVADHTGAVSYRKIAVE